MDSHINPLNARHIQNMSETKTLEHHWGYADHALPCPRDVKTCEYLDLVYSGHDYSMLFVGIFWAMAIGVLLIWAFARSIWTLPKADKFLVVGHGKIVYTTSKPSAIVKGTMASFFQSHFLPDSIRVIFGRTTRLQVSLIFIPVSTMQPYFPFLEIALAGIIFSPYPFILTVYSLLLANARIFFEVMRYRIYYLNMIFNGPSNGEPRPFFLLVLMAAMLLLAWVIVCDLFEACVRWTIRERGTLTQIFAYSFCLAFLVRLSGLR
ncbi:hypothetical protein LZL87_010635 [Fusarium oxysporum]|uniref:Uncharacterized protein n=1 Tax=Fusarium oxysporum f. sp. rapae TaxID=485398 RepID=A0A8J5P3R7_FUSOX|nr:hypothetical protein Forpe1208_v008409 [Fusarium oxysporum f. sp. rapae]KAI7763580.1 hypothetical protein LZL87_010635 [Fusarium oxysporum]